MWVLKKKIKLFKDCYKNCSKCACGMEKQNIILYIVYMLNFTFVFNIISRPYTLFYTYIMYINSE